MVRIKQTLEEGTARPAFWLTAQIVGTDRMGGRIGQKTITQFRVDTGADLTSITAAVYDQLKAEHSDKRPIIRMSNGARDKPLMVYVSLIINGRTYTPWRGVMVARGPVCFMGMDILDRFDIHKVDDVMILEPNDAPEV